MTTTITGLNIHDSLINDLITVITSLDDGGSREASLTDFSTK